MIAASDDDVVKHFDFQKLPAAYQIAGNIDVSRRRSAFAAYVAYGISGVIPRPVLCRM
jgi:hypothetical protein